MADGHPDFSGVWWTGGDVGGRGFGGGRGRGGRGAAGPAPADVHRLYNPAAAAAAKKMDDKDDPTLKCIPTAFGTLNVSMFDVGAVGQIVATPKFVLMLTETFHGYRLVPTDGRPHREEVPPSYRGDSVGRWEGDVFVVDTKNFTDDTWIWAEGRVITPLRSAADRRTLSARGQEHAGDRGDALRPEGADSAVDRSEADAGARAVRPDPAVELRRLIGVRKVRGGGAIAPLALLAPFAPFAPSLVFASRSVESLIHTARSSRRGESPS